MIKIIKIRDTVERLLPRFHIDSAFCSKLGISGTDQTISLAPIGPKIIDPLFYPGYRSETRWDFWELVIFQKSFLVRMQRIGPKSIGQTTPISENIMILFISNKLVTP